MNRIKKTGESIQQKLIKNSKSTKKSFTVTSSFTIDKDDLDSTQQEQEPARQITSKKKMTFYIPYESEVKLNEVYTRALMRNRKLDKSTLISKAIELLWKEDKNYEI
jgi:hypothetical protein